MDSSTARLLWILLLHLPDLRAKICQEQSINATSTRLHLNKTLPRYTVQCQSPPGAMAKMMNRKIYEIKTISVQFEHQSLIIGGDPRPARCRLNWTDQYGNRYSENCVAHDTDGGKAALSERSNETHNTIPPTVVYRRHWITLITLFFGLSVACFVLKKILRKKLASEKQPPPNNTDMLDHPNTVPNECADDRDALLTNGNGVQVEDIKMNNPDEMEPQITALASPQGRRLLIRKRTVSNSS